MIAKTSPVAVTASPASPTSPAPPTSPASGTGAAADRTPLVIDLDGTLARVDVLHECLVGLLAGGLSDLCAVAMAARRGRPAVKAAAAARALPDVSHLPYRDEVLDLIRKARAAGRPVFLVTAADQRVADAVAAHLGLFDGAHGSDGTINLGGEAKAGFLVERFGEGGFDYAGDHRKDLAVWRRARKAVAVGTPPAVLRALREEAASRGQEVLVLDPPASRFSRLRARLRALRPHQWLKNSLVFLPMIAAYAVTVPNLTAALLTFVAFSLTASSVYCLNDLLDLEADRAHPRKRRRPFAAGEVPALEGALMAAGLLLLGFALAATINAMTFGVLSVYFGATLLYSLALKRELVIDICLLAGLYTLRVIAGALAVEVNLSPWMMALSVFLFLSLAAMKRQTELVDLARSGRETPSGRAYRAEDLTVVTMMAIAAGYTAVLVLALYIYSPAVQRLYVSPLLLWGAPPILLYWISRMVMIAHRGNMDDDPVLFAVRDPISLACGAGVVAVALAARAI